MCLDFSSISSSTAISDIHSEILWVGLWEWFSQANTLTAIMLIFFAFILLFHVSSFQLAWRHLRKIKANVYGFILLMLFSAGLFFYNQYLKSLWAWLCSDEAGNLGSFLFSLVALASFIYGPYLIRRWQEEKSAEKMSDIAEYGLNYLYTFLEETKTWLKFSTSWMVYSRHSKGNEDKKEMLSGEEREEFLKNLATDPYEMHNFCKSGDAIIKNLHAVIHRVKRLSDPVVDKKLATLYEYARKLPGKLFDVHFINNPKETKQAAKEYLRDASSVIEKSCADIDTLLMNYLMFKNRRRSGHDEI